MAERKRSGAALPYMAPEDKARNYALGLELTELKEKLAQEVKQLTAAPWAIPGDIPLLELEEIIHVRVPLTQPYRAEQPLSVRMMPRNMRYGRCDVEPCRSSF